MNNDASLDELSADIYILWDEFWHNLSLVDHKSGISTLSHCHILHDQTSKTFIARARDSEECSRLKQVS